MSTEIKNNRIDSLHHSAVQLVTDLKKSAHYSSLYSEVQVN